MPDSYQHISVTNDQQATILTIELKSITQYDLARDLEKELVEAARTGDSKNVIVNLEKLQFMSSVAYMPFISARSCVRNDGGQIVLCNLSDVVKEIFESTRLLINPQSPKSMFEYADTLDNAVAMLSTEH